MQRGDSSKEPSKDRLIQYSGIVADESGRPLTNAKVTLLTVNVPEIAYTDNNGAGSDFVVEALRVLRREEVIGAVIQSDEDRVMLSHVLERRLKERPGIQVWIVCFCNRCIDVAERPRRAGVILISTAYTEFTS